MPTLALFIDFGGWASVIDSVTKLVVSICGPIVAIYTIRCARDIRRVEKATNSMKDALVQKTGEAEHAKGWIDGKQAGRAAERTEEAERKAGNP